MLGNFLVIFLLLFCDFSLAAAPKIQRANIYSDDVQVDEFLVSEKLDGVRGYFDGTKFISRQGNIINAPEWFIKDFPKEHLDGELWIGRGKFELVSKIIRSKKPKDEDWKKLRFMIFDLPKSPEIFLKRYQAMLNLVAQSNSKYLQAIEQFEVKDKKQLNNLLELTIKNGGEGLMLHRKNSFYKAERNDDLLKLKTFEDAEGVVIAHIAGKGKFANKMGALLVEIESEDKNGQKIRFKIGSGFTDEQRKNPPKIGSKITYKFYGKTTNNIPRFASFWRERSGE
jgi:DNA ligase-1